jgi:RecA-family ATPase
VTNFTNVRQNGARRPGRGHGAFGAAPKPPLQMLAFKDDAVPFLEDAWLVEDVLPEEGLGVIFGAPGSRKTFTAIDLALHIAGGYDHWRGKRVERRICMYLSLEGGRRFSNRLAAWRQFHGLDAPLFYRCAEKLDLRSHEDDAERVIVAGKAFVEQTGERMGMVVVDTLNRAMPGGNENAVEDMGAFVALCDAIARELQCFVLIVHHSGKDTAKGSRGHSSLLGAIDTEICVADGEMTVTKQRDGDTNGLQFAVGLEMVELGTTPTGKPVT